MASLHAARSVRRTLSTSRASALLLLGLVAANLLAWSWALTAFSGHPALLSTALLAYLFGLRHAVDADHIAAIDNTVRKLMQQQQRPLGVGFFFSLGHSAVVIIAVALIVFATATLQSHVIGFKQIGSVIGTSVSALFLLGIALINLSVLRDVWQHFRRVRRGERIDEAQLDLLLGNRGLLARMLRPLFRLVTKSWHLFPIGFLFGLGFDTATEIGLFAMAAAHTSDGIPLWHLMVFPVLFTAGMALIDTIDSMLMVGAYGWAFVNPVRKLWYNLTITLISVIVAVAIGGLEALGLIADRFALSGGVWDWITALNENLAHFGYFVIALFMASWAISAAIYKWKRFDSLTEAR
ncbi:HoxN/HupN/NixA family nickel/cobalt transporter [Vogesella facilis]|uniref:Nickel/cobalt efflux system n=1 Tax=Vogesella facilis TaxID=1655232 RepID=A0ABV7RD56_9NEIS